MEHGQHRMHISLAWDCQLKFNMETRGEETRGKNGKKWILQDTMWPK